MRTNVRSGRRGCPRGQRVGALLSNLLIAGMHTCCAPFAPLAGKSPSRHVTRAPSATDWIAPWMQHLLECPEQTVAVSNNAESRVSIQTSFKTPQGDPTSTWSAQVVASHMFVSEIDVSIPVFSTL